MSLDGFKRDAAHVGWINALLARMLTRIQLLLGVQIYRVNLRPLPSRPVDPGPPAGMRLCVLQVDQLLQAAADPELGLEPDFIRRALAQGDMAFGAFEGDHLIGYNWRTATVAPFFESFWIRVGQRCHYAYKSFVRPSHRGRRIHIAITHLADRWSLEKGGAGEIGFVNIANLASLGAAKSLGRRKIGYAGYVTLFGHDTSFRTAGVRKLGIEMFRPDEAPVGLAHAQG